MRPTRRIKVAMVGGQLALGVAVAVLALAQPGCPKPMPTPNGPVDASDAAPFPAPPPKPSAATCDAACTAAEIVCPGRVDDQACRQNCPRLGIDYAAKLIDAKNCDDVHAADRPPPPPPGPGAQRGR